jgi:hypothetical protein
MIGASVECQQVQCFEISSGDPLPLFTLPPRVIRGLAVRECNVQRRVEHVFF